MSYIFLFIESILILYIPVYYFKLKNIKLMIILIITYLELMCINTTALPYLLIITLFLYLLLIEKKQIKESFFTSTFSALFFSLSFYLEKILTSNNVEQFTNVYERIVIHFVLLFIYTIIKSIFINYKNKYHNNQLMMMFIIIIFLISSFSRLLLNQTLSTIEIQIDLLCCFILTFICIEVFYTINDISSSNEDKDHYLKVNKLSLLSQSELLNAFNRSNQLNHNMKYTLMNIQYYLQDNNIDNANEYISTVLNDTKKNSLCYSANPIIDYTINKFLDILNKNGIVMKMDIILDKNSSFNNIETEKSLSHFLDENMTLIKNNSITHLSLISRDKGDFLIFKLEYDLEELTHIDSSMPLKFIGHNAYNSLIISSNDDKNNQ